MLLVVAAHTVGDRYPRHGRIDTRTDDHRGVIKGVVKVSAADDVSACLREMLEMAVRTYQTAIERTTTSLIGGALVSGWCLSSTYRATYYNFQII
jgi:hypothetical protein